MSEGRSESSEVYNHYLELSKPTTEDLKRVFTEMELKELCLRQKCIVDMWRWNVVNDYRILFTESRRYQRWSRRDRLRMLAKAVNKWKPAVLYDEEDIIETRRQEWGLQLKENILSLNFWERKRFHNPLVMPDSHNIDQAVQVQCEASTESMNMVDLLTHSENENLPDQDISDSNQQVEIIEVNTESITTGELLAQPQWQEGNVSNLPTYREIHTVPQNFTQLMNAETEVSLERGQAYNNSITNGGTLSTNLNVEENIFLADFSGEHAMEEDSEDSVETVLLKEPIETLQSEEVAPEIQNIYDVNTMSMTIDSQMCTQSQNLANLQSEDVIPSNYDFFKNVVPSTSTQSQQQEFEEISKF